MDNEFILFDRIQKIKSTIEKYGENNFYISYSGGKDSNVLSTLIDMALPNNKIPRVYCDTGIELQAVKDFVLNKTLNDSRYDIIKPKISIKKMLENNGYPFKSKTFSWYYFYFSKLNKKVTELPENNIYRKYIEGNRLIKTGKYKNTRSFDNCPKKLQYLFYDNAPFKISDKCCYELKEKPLNDYCKQHNISYAITGLTRSEGGRRASIQCLTYKDDKLIKFHPLAPLKDTFIEWFILKYNIKLPIIYYEPYNFKRTGCSGCPYNIDLQNTLDYYKQYMPNELKKAESVWKPVYSEYRRIGYRLKSRNENQLTFDDITIMPE